MTAEIAVMNKDAVALAADSTITISGRKTYHSTNKLFSLSVSQPVGIMIYGSGEIGGIPWETVVKLYRKQLGDRKFDHLYMYKDDLMLFMEKTLSDQFNCDETDDYVSESAELTILKFFDSFDHAIKDAFEKQAIFTKLQIRELIKDAINEIHSALNYSSFLGNFSLKNVLSLESKYSENIFQLIDEHAQDHKISKPYKKKLLRICVVNFLSKSTEVSGLVFAGFGDKDLFPSALNCNIECVVEGKIKHRFFEASIENKPDNDAYILPFAQYETVATFMEGISKKILDSVKSINSQKLGKYSSILRKSLVEKGVPVNDIDDVLKTIDLDLAASELEAAVKKVQYEHHIKPVLDSITYLPKNEMAEVAEALVSITSFRQKISLEQESVGGAIDVAIISKSDGFIWIKRKHYFKPELNPMYMKRFNFESCGDQ